MRSDVSSLKKQLSSNFSGGTKDRRGSTSVVDGGRKIQILSTDEIAGLSKRKRKRISVMKDKNSEKINERYSEGNSNEFENDKADDTVEFQIPAQHNQVPVQNQNQNPNQVNMNQQQHMGIPQNYQNPYPSGYSVQTFNENTPYQQPY